MRYGLLLSAVLFTISASATDIEGTVRLANPKQPTKLMVGYAGMCKGGQVPSMNCAAMVGGVHKADTITKPNQLPQSVKLSYTKKSEKEPSDHCTFTMTSLDPGVYLVYAYTDTYLDWKWVFVKADNAKQDVSLEIDPSKGGTLELSLPPVGSAPAHNLHVLPVAMVNDVPLALDPRIEQVTEIETTDTKLEMTGFRAGAYYVKLENGGEQYFEIKTRERTVVDLTKKPEVKAEKPAAKEVKKENK